MKVFKKLFVIFLSLIMVFCASSCKEKISEYPVSFGGAELDIAPLKVISLSDVSTSVIKLLGYDDRLIQGEFGNAITPNVETIKASGANLVITPTAFSTSIVSDLNSVGVKVASIATPTNYEELKSYYVALASLFGGNITGKGVALEIIKDYEESFKNINTFIGNKEKFSYVLFYEKDYAASNISFLSNVLNKCNGENLAGENILIDANKLQELNPNIIIAPNDLTKDFTNEQLNAVKNKKVLGVDIASFNNMGEGFMNSIYTILDFVYEDFIVNPKEALEE